MMGITRTTAGVRIKNGTIPGGECCYAYENREGERWHVLRETFDNWRANAKKGSAA